MHPKIDFPGLLAPIFQDLARPLDDGLERDPRRVARPGDEADLARGYRLDPGPFAAEQQLERLETGLRRLLAGALKASEGPGGYPIRLVRGAPAGAPAKGREAYRLRVAADGCTVEARDLEGLRRGLYRLEDELRLRRAPVLPLGEWTRWTAIADRITRSPVAPYRWLSGWELEDAHDYYPEAYLDRLAHSGINGIWVAGLLRNLVASHVIPELGPERHRLGKLRALVEKAARFGIRVHFFCMEPRALPPGHPAALAHPEIVGVRKDIYETLCPSEPRVLDYLREAIRDLFVEVPGLGGLIDLCKGERPTICWWWSDEVARLCPRCGTRPQAEVLARTLGAFVDGMRAAGSSAPLVAWPYLPYAFDRKTGRSAPVVPIADLIRECPPEVRWMGNFEHGGVKRICGEERSIQEYSLSAVEPGPVFREFAEGAAAAGREVYAKLQIGTTYELSSVPAVPVPGAVHEKLAAMKALGATGSMFSWIIGGFPGPMLAAAGEAAFEPVADKAAFLRRLAALAGGEAAAGPVAAAWECFERVWRRYPFDLGVLYHGPLTRGPAYQLHLEREARLPRVYNWGWERDRQPQFYAYAPEKWLGFLKTPDVTRCFRDMAEEWRQGVSALEEGLRAAGGNPDLERQLAVAAAIRLHFLSAANVYEFYSVRDRILETPEAQRGALLQRMREIVEREVEVAEALKPLLGVEPALGFHSELYAYCYTIAALDEKIRRARDVGATLERWARSGVEEAVLRHTVEEAERQRPDRWGD